MPNQRSGPPPSGSGVSQSPVTVTLKNIRGIQYLKFEMPQPGLWLLTGANGCGKSSLLVALYRLGESYAFPNFYRNGRLNKIDNYRNSKIIYKIDEKLVTYSRGEQRWTPNPKFNNLRRDLYKKVIFINADVKRIQPKQDEINNLRNIQPVNEKLKDFMSEILNDNKWKNLFEVKRQGKAKAYLISTNKNNEKQYFSEKNFSLGELCLLRLGEKLINQEKENLILIEEIDMALHPRAQIKLYNQLKEMANTKRHTILFSSHSSCLIKKACPRNAMLLKRDSSDKVTVTKEPTISQALDEVAYDEDEVLVDIIYFVEDLQAQLLLHSLINEYSKQSNRNNITFRIIPVGGYSQVVKMCRNSSCFTARHIRKYGFVDKDVENKHIVEHSEVKALPITPEIGLINFLERQNNLTISNFNLRLDNITRLEEYRTIKSDKFKLKFILNQLSNSLDSSYSENYITRILYEHYAKWYIQNNKDQLHELLAPTFNNLGLPRQRQ